MELEFLVEDVNLYHDLARAERPAAGLQTATRGLPERSRRYREFLRPHGYGDELRAILRVDGSAWASVTLLRRAGAPAFDERDADLLGSLSEPLASAVRDHAQVGAPAAPPVDRGPGLLVFDAAGELVSMNDEALAWLDELAGEPGGDEPFELRLPMVVVSTLIRARAIAARRYHRSARARLRSSASDRWLVCHASCLRDTNGDLGDTALVIEPAAPSEIAPIVTEAYDLTPRERQDHAADRARPRHRRHRREPALSAHTVRDYVKAVFNRVGVSSRGELVAKLFAEHYAPLHLDPNGLDAVQD